MDVLLIDILLIDILMDVLLPGIVPMDIPIGMLTIGIRVFVRRPARVPCAFHVYFDDVTGTRAPVLRPLPPQFGHQTEHIAPQKDTVHGQTPDRRDRDPVEQHLDRRWIVSHGSIFTGIPSRPNRPAAQTGPVPIRTRPREEVLAIVSGKS